MLKRLSREEFVQLMVSYLLSRDAQGAHATRITGFTPTGLGALYDHLEADDPEREIEPRTLCLRWTEGSQEDMFEYAGVNSVHALRELYRTVLEVPENNRVVIYLN